MSDHPEIPDIGPTEGQPRNPTQWITTHGPVRWATSSVKTKCEDCLHLILDHLNGKQSFDRAPGLARAATWKRTQGSAETYHCGEHKQWRQKELGE